MEGVYMYMHYTHTHTDESEGIIIETHVSCQTRPASGQIELDEEMKSALMEIRRVVLERREKS